MLSLKGPVLLQKSKRGGTVLLLLLGHPFQEHDCKRLILEKLTNQNAPGLTAGSFPSSQFGNALLTQFTVLIC